MLGNLKKKFNIAIQEGITISENLSQQYLRTTPTSPSFESFASKAENDDFLNLADLGISPEVNITAGCALLSKYEDDWQNIHKANEENGEKATEIANKIEEITKTSEKHHVIMKDLIACLSTIPSVVAKLKESIETLAEVQELSLSAENKILALQNICEECVLQEEITEKHFELSRYKQKKMAELEKFRQKLAAEHQEKIRLHEDKLRQIQKERQAVFEDAFQCDLEEFKEKGSLRKLDHKDVSNSTEVALEEVDLDNTDSKDALEEFLNA